MKDRSLSLHGQEGGPRFRPLERQARIQRPVAVRNYCTGFLYNLGL
jgi:hypothetical protein